MIAALALLAALGAPQDTLGLSPRAREMLDRFVPPVNGEVTVATRFSEDTVWLGEQVELVTATWFPRSLRERLRRQPSLRTPALSGLWSAPASTTPQLADTRRVSGLVYDLFVSHQTLFPLGAGTIEAPPAVLTYAVPSSSSFFAPEERQSLSSRPARLVVRPIPAGLAARLGSGPTARGLSVRWQLPTGSAVAGAPVTVELVLSGAGNVSLWPAPEIAWPATVRVYAEPTEEVIRRPGGIVSGEKRFRFTLVADSAGVVTLPRVRYPHFDPVRVQVVIAAAPAVGLAVRPPGSAPLRAAIPASQELRTPFTSRVVRDWWPLLLLIVATPLLAALRRRPHRAPSPASVSRSVEADLRMLLGASTDASPSSVALALRRRGASREEAELVRAWLADLGRHRWAAGHPTRPDDRRVAGVVEGLRRAGRRGVALVLALAAVHAVPLHGQWQEALDRYRANDGIAAESLFAKVTIAHPASPDAWLDLGAARWLAGDEVGAVAAWVQGVRVAPRDARLHGAIDEVANLPAPVRGLVPVVPLGRDELVLLAVLTWPIAWFTRRRWRRVAQSAAVVCAVAGGLALWRTVSASREVALVRPGAVLRVSPVVTAPDLGPVPAWSLARLERRQDDWWLVRIDGGRDGWVAGSRLASLSRLD